ncbi:MAG: hypothetical protein M1514_02260 [Patescibacteria group bacterium]|nr:hypothetical protein [Patescibacteria group bacterium]
MTQLETEQFVYTNVLSRVEEKGFHLNETLIFTPLGEQRLKLVAEIADLTAVAVKGILAEGIIRDLKGKQLSDLPPKERKTFIAEASRCGSEELWWVIGTQTNFLYDDQDQMYGKMINYFWTGYSERMEWKKDEKIQRGIDPKEIRIEDLVVEAWQGEKWLKGKAKEEAKEVFSAAKEFYLLTNPEQRQSLRGFSEKTLDLAKVFAQGSFDFLKLLQVSLSLACFLDVKETSLITFMVEKQAERKGAIIGNKDDKEKEWQRLRRIAVLLEL